MLKYVKPEKLEVPNCYATYTLEIERLVNVGVVLISIVLLYCLADLVSLLLFPMTFAASWFTGRVHTGNLHRHG